MFWKNKKKKLANKLTETSVQGRVRGFILDSQIDNGHDISVMLGCSPISDDVAEREEEESDKRLAKISHLYPLIHAHANALAQGTVDFKKSGTSEILSEIPDEIWKESRSMVTDLVISGITGSIAQLIDMGFLEIPKSRKRK
jgi:hypothetical protein